MKRHVVLVLLIVFLPAWSQSLGSPNISIVAHAQSPEPENSAPIFQQQRHLEKRRELRTLYTQQVEKYRIKENDFVIAKNQYLQLQTLSSLETAVQTTRDVMIIRTQVLLTYTELVQLTLADSPGVNLVRKEQLLTDLTSMLEELAVHQLAVENTTDRLEIDARAEEFDLLGPRVTSLLYETQSVIAVAKLQTVYDQILLIHQDIKTAQEEDDVSAIRRSQRARANQEVDRNVQEVKAELAEVDEKSKPRDLISRSFYTTILDDLSPVYADLSQAVSYLEELLRI